jgi:hypothetical protein
MYKVQVSYHGEKFGDYPELPYYNLKLAKVGLSKHIKLSNEKYADLMARWRIKEITEDEGLKLQQAVVDWHKNLD